MAYEVEQVLMIEPVEPEAVVEEQQYQIESVNMIGEVLPEEAQLEVTVEPEIEKTAPVSAE